jgi:hypothetical protein
MCKACEELFAKRRREQQKEVEKQAIDNFLKCLANEETKAYDTPKELIDDLHKSREEYQAKKKVNEKKEVPK